MSGIAILPLREQPQRIDALAAWHHREWGDLFGPLWTLEAARQELRAQLDAAGIPCTLLAVCGDVLLGSVSLFEEDAPEFRAVGSPWLGSLYVDRAARGQGIGSMLVRAATRLAAELGVQRLWLFTPDQAAFYRRLGWRDESTGQLFGHDVQLMSCVPSDCA